jgi:lysyl-tRNA synthetase class I
LVKQIRDQYEAVKNKQSGYIRIRFIVNCNGETGRFRVIQANEQYQEQAFDESITNQLLTIVKSLDGWNTQKGKENPEDYYQYLVFKMKNGEIIEIMP